MGKIIDFLRRVFPMPASSTQFWFEKTENKNTKWHKLIKRGLAGLQVATKQNSTKLDSVHESIKKDLDGLQIVADQSSTKLDSMREITVSDNKKLRADMEYQLEYQHRKFLIDMQNLHKKIIVSKTDEEMLSTPGPNDQLDKVLDYYGASYSNAHRLPHMIKLEVSSACQLRCPACYMQVHAGNDTGIGMLKFSDFKTLIDTNPYIALIEMSNSGEIFLNPELRDMIQYAYERGVKLAANTGVNLNTISDEMREALVKYRFCSMRISIDGASQETYSKYRVNGNFDTVIENITKIQEYKKQYGSPYPRIYWKYIIMETNDEESEIRKAIQMAKELGVHIEFVKTYEPTYRPSQEKIDMIKKVTGLSIPFVAPLDKDAPIPKPHDTKMDATKSEITSNIMNNACRQLWEMPVINWDGRLLGCCDVYDNDFGVNVFELGLENALKSKNMVYAKDMLTGKIPFSQMPLPDNIEPGCAASNGKHEHIPCVHCARYGYIWQNKKYIDVFEPVFSRFTAF